MLGLGFVARGPARPALPGARPARRLGLRDDLRRPRRRRSSAPACGRSSRTGTTATDDLLGSLFSGTGSCATAARSAARSRVLLWAWRAAFLDLALFDIARRAAGGRLRGRAHRLPARGRRRLRRSRGTGRGRWPIPTARCRPPRGAPDAGLRDARHGLVAVVLWRLRHRVPARRPLRALPASWRASSASWSSSSAATSAVRRAHRSAADLARDDASPARPGSRLPCARAASAPSRRAAPPPAPAAPAPASARACQAARSCWTER